MRYFGDRETGRPLTQAVLTCREPLDDRCDYLPDTSLQLAVVGYGGADGDFGGGDGGDALGDHLGGVD